MDADVLVLKYAQEFYGVDREVAELLGYKVPPVTRLYAGTRGSNGDMPDPGESKFVPSSGVARASAILFVGVPPLTKFDYEEVRRFGSRPPLESAAEHAPGTRHIVAAIHGANIGLDEAESFRAQIGGFIDALDSQRYPPSLERISIVELDPRRAERLASVLKELLPIGYLSVRRQGHLHGERERAVNALHSVGQGSRSKPTAFVAMPFATEYDDYFHYGIRGAANASGFLCERADLSAFTGDVLDWVKGRIESATIVIADLTAANPNVYLEVGFAWGKEIPTVLLIRKDSELKFDVRGQRCLKYENMRDLEERLSAELSALRSDLL